MISVYQARDDMSALDKIVIYGENRPISWTNAASRFFEDFPQYLRNQMEHDGLFLHAHTYSTSMQSYIRIPGLHNEMIVT